MSTGHPANENVYCVLVDMLRAYVVWATERCVRPERPGYGAAPLPSHTLWNCARVGSLSWPPVNAGSIKLVAQLVSSDQYMKPALAR